MALFRKLFYRKPPDGLLEICERVYVFDCCFTTDALEEQDYKGYVGGIVGQLREYYPDASILAFNFREGETQTQMANALTEYEMTIMEYPRQYEGCPLLPMEVIHHFLRSSESWLSLGLQNLLLMHCERGGWPVLAFMLAALLIYRRHYNGEFKTLDMVYKQAPRELLHLLSPLNPIPSQIRYLQYVSRRNVGTEWPPLDRALTMDCVIIRMIPNFDGEGGCRPIFRIYGQDPFLVSDRSPKVLFSTPKKSRAVRHYKQTECEIIKVDINCHIQGDVVLECISLHDDTEREEMMFRVMFNTAFIRSNILMLNRDEIDILWDGKDLYPKDFRAEVLFSEMDNAASVVPVDISCFEEKDGLPVEAFAKVQEIFSSVDWLDPKGDAGVEVLQHLTASNKPIEAYSHAEKSKVNQSLEALKVASLSNSPKYLTSQNKSHLQATATPHQLSIESPLPLLPKQEADFVVQKGAAKDVFPKITASTSPNFISLEDKIGIKSVLPPVPIRPQEIPTSPMKDDITIIPSIMSSPTENSQNHDKVNKDGSPISEHPSSIVFSTKDVAKATRVATDPPLPPMPTHSPSIVDVGELATPELHLPSTTHSSDLNANRATGGESPSSHISSAKLEINVKTSPSTSPQNLYASPINESSASKYGPTPSAPLSPSTLARKESSFSGVEPPPSPTITSHLIDISANRPTYSPPPPHLVHSIEGPCDVEGRLSLPPPPPLSGSGTVPPPPSTLPLRDNSSARLPPPAPPIFLEPLKERSGEREVPLSPPSVTKPAPPPPPPPPYSEQGASSVTKPAPSPPPPPPYSEQGTSSVTERTPPPPPTPPPEPPKDRSSEGGPPLLPPPPCSSPGVLSVSKPAPCPPPPPPEPPHARCSEGDPFLPPHPPCSSAGVPAPCPPPPPPPPCSIPSVPAPCPPPPPLEPPKERSSGPPVPPPPPNSGGVTTIDQPTLPAPPPPPGPATTRNPPSVPSAPPPPLHSPKSPASLSNSVLPSGSRNSNLPGLPSPPPPSIPPGTKGKSLLSRGATSRTNQAKKLKPLHWLKISRAVSGSLWADAQRSGEASKAPEIDISELESLFSAAVPTPDQNGSGRKAGSRGSMGQKPEKVQLIEHRRAYNCEIMLSKVKIPLHDMLSSVLALEDSTLDVDQVDNLIKFCPTKEEMDMLKGYKGERENLGKCEQFFLELMQVPRIEYKLRVFSFKIQFQTQVSDLRNSLNVVNSAADQIKGSAKLKRIMQTILSLGNALNQGTARGSAVGFRLDSLLKLIETRARNNKMTLMHYLCKVLSDKLPELLDFWKDLSSLEPASKIQLKYLAEEMQAINKGLEKVMQELSMSESDGPVSDQFCKALKEFLCFSEGEVRSLASLYAGVGRNVDSLILYFGEDPSRCPFEQVISTLLNFVRMFKRSHEENCKQLEFERKKAEKEASEKLKMNASETGHLLQSQVRSVK